MKKINRLTNLLSVSIVLFLFLKAYNSFEIVSFNKRGIVFNTETKVPKKDRMDLAWEQEFELTKDPKLNMVPRERLLAAWQYQQQLLVQTGLRKAAIPGVTWVERGPKNCGGRTRSLMVDLNDPTKKTVWSCSVAGGIWKTTDITSASPNWTVIDDFFQNLAITHIDQAPRNPQVMYFCTGEGNSNLDAVRGLGVWKSINGGNTWAQLSSTNNSNFYYCQKVMPIGIGDTVLALTKSGLYRSSNGGSTFTKVLASGIASAGNIAYDLEVMKNGTIYATMSTGSSGGGTIHKSYNSGITWTNPLTLPSYFSKDEMEIAVSGNDTNIIYALVENASRIQGILKSSNAGVSFDTVASHPIDADGGVSEPNNIKDFSRNQAWYDLSLAVDPNNPNVAVVGGVDLFKTTNGGASWTQLSHWYGGYGYQEVHADQHYAYFEPGSSTVCYFGNDGGIYRSTNFTASMPTIESKETNYNTTQFYACDIHPTAANNMYLAGAQDNGSHGFFSAGINNTTEVTGGDGAFCHIDQNQPNYWFTSYVYTSYYRSTNSGNSFSNVLNTSVNVGSFISPSDYDDVNNKMYLCGNNSYFVRWDNPQTGNSLTYDTVPLFNGGKITHVKVSPNVNNRVYFGLNNGRIVRVDNAHIAATVDSCINNGKGMPTGSVSCIEVETGNDNHILATYSNYGVASVWETKDGGLTWVNVENNLPDMPIRWALFNPYKNWQVLLATELGVWSTDSVRGATTNWQPTNSGFSNVRTDMLKMRSSDKQVMAATHGRGVFTSNVFAPPSADFVVDKRIAYQSSILNFTSTSNGATSYSWDFGDGTFSTAQNPTKQYFAPGFYTVILSINSGLYSKTSTNYIQILPYRAVPYLVTAGGNFESNPNDFGPETITGIGFVRGSSSTTGKSGVASGSNAWVTGLTGNYADNNEARLYTPNFNFGASGTYTLKFKVKNKFEVSYDGYIVEYSLNLGLTWTKLGNSVQTNWYDFANSSGNTAFTMGIPYFSATNSAYTNKQFDVSFLAGNSKVCFRWVFKSDEGITDVGMALDDFEVLGPTNAALPVTYTKFYGNRLSENLISLHWETGSEINNKGFSIEKSTNGFDFFEVEFIKGMGQSNSLQSYAFQDNEAEQDHLYYRLNQIDINGNSKYSNILYFNQNIGKEKLFIVQYLSNIDGITIESGSKNTDLKIWTQGGVLIQNHHLVNEVNQIQLNNLAKGVYLLEMTDQLGNRQVEKLIWLGE